MNNINYQDLKHLVKDTFSDINQASEILNQGTIECKNTLEKLLSFWNKDNLDNNKE